MVRFRATKTCEQLFVGLSNQAMTIHFLIIICVGGGTSEMEVSLK
jgi:hypothetical protein